MTTDDNSEQPRKRARLSSPDESKAPNGDASALDSDTADQSAYVGSIEEHIAQQLEQEQKAGISVFAADGQSFSCIVKQRFTDFLVNEILPSGQVLHLVEDAPTPKQKEAPKSKSNDKAPDSAAAKPALPTEAQPKTEDSTPDQKGQAHKNAAEENTHAHPISSEDVATLVAIFGDETTKEMQTLSDKIVARPDKKPRDFGTLQSKVIEDKQERTDGHVAVRRIFQGRIETVTNDDNTIAIKGAAAQRAAKNPRSLPQKGNGPRVKGKVGWDELGGEHLHFTLYKENKDTMEVLYFIASLLKLHVKSFQMAGTKDRRGVTVQKVSAYRIAAERLQSINPRLRGARLAGFSYQPKGLELGDLSGNEFVITLRDCRFKDTDGKDLATKLKTAEAVVSETTKHFQSRGFINYYGLQRFGAFAISTDEIGKRMLKGDLEGAVNGILSYTPETLADAQDSTSTSKISQDDKARAEALHIWQTTHKTGAALDKLPRRFQAENAVIRHLGWTDRRTGDRTQSQDFQGALMTIARNLRLMYVHAHQSLIWNTVAAKRWELYGGQVVEGDLVIVGEHEQASSGPEDDVDDQGEIIVRPAVEDSAAAPDEKFERARPLSKKEAESGVYSIFDVVLPQPGFDVLYPANAIGEFYKEFMASERGGGIDPHKMRRSWKDISLSGSYRKVMARPANVSYQIRAYKEDDEQMVQTDLERIQQADSTSAGMDVDAKIGAGAGEDKIALVLKMQLGSSQYATMALRELTKGGAVAFKTEFQGGR